MSSMFDIFNNRVSEVSEYEDETLREMLTMIPKIQEDLATAYYKKGPLDSNDKVHVAECAYIWLPVLRDFIISECKKRKAQMDSDNSDMSKFKSQCDSTEE